MFKLKKINHKLIFSFLSLSLIPLIIFSFINIKLANDAIQAQVFNQLKAVSSIKKVQVLNYLSKLKDSLEVLNDDPYIHEALDDFSQALDLNGLESDEWHQAEKKYANHFKKINKINAWYDLFFINLKGDIVFTATKESDF